MTRIVALTNNSPHAWIVLNALVEEFGPLTVLTEDPEKKAALILRRMKRQGLVKVIGQVAFVLLQKLLMTRLAAGRIAAIIRDRYCDPSPNVACEIIPIGSVNSTACRTALAMLRPDVVVVFGTRIIGRETLAAIKSPIINFHSGINPKYRGQAGGYWALAMGDAENAGVTVHLVDEGVDTGAVLHQAKVVAAKGDSFASYFYLQAAAIRPLAVKAVNEALRGELKPYKPDLPSQLFYHPTIWFYLWTGIRKGVW